MAGPSHPNCFVPSYGMRYVAKVLKMTLAEKFPAAPESEVYKVGRPSSPSPQGPVSPQTETRGRGPCAVTPEGERLGPSPSSRSGLLCDLEWGGGLLWVLSL